MQCRTSLYVDKGAVNTGLIALARDIIFMSYRLQVIPLATDIMFQNSLASDNSCTIFLTGPRTLKYSRLGKVLRQSNAMLQ